MAALFGGSAFCAWSWAAPGGNLGTAVAFPRSGTQDGTEQPASVSPRTATSTARGRGTGAATPAGPSAPPAPPPPPPLAAPPPGPAGAGEPFVEPQPLGDLRHVVLGHQRLHPHHDGRIHVRGGRLAPQFSHSFLQEPGVQIEPHGGDGAG